MDPDLFLTIGIILAVLSLPSLLSAWVDGRRPRAAAAALVLAALMIVAAFVQRPGGYGFAEIPHVMLGVVGRYIY